MRTIQIVREVVSTEIVTLQVTEDQFQCLQGLAKVHRGVLDCEDLSRTLDFAVEQAYQLDRVELSRRWGDNQSRGIMLKLTPYNVAIDWKHPDYD